MALHIHDWSLTIPATGASFRISIEQMRLEKGEIVFIFGRSGAGKTTFFSIIAGVIASSLRDEVVRHFPRLAYIMHESSLLPWRSVGGNLRAECQLRRITCRADRFVELLTSFGLPSGIWDVRAGRLSLGMRQRVELAKALCLKPDMLIIDEGFAGIDFDSKLPVFESLLKQVRKERMVLLGATHQIIDLARLADRVYFIEDGRIADNFAFSTEIPALLRSREEDLVDLRDVKEFLKHVK